MLVMPILNTGKNGTTRIYNVMISLKTASKVRENTVVNGIDEKDVVIGSSSFNNSLYNTKNKEDNVIVNFIRSKNSNMNRKNFLVTTRNYANKMTYDLYNVEMPPRKVTKGLDNLYGKAILDIQKQIPDIKKGRYVSLKKMGVVDHISDERLEQLRYIVDNAPNEANLQYMLLAHSLGDLKATLEFIKLFDFTIISEATVYESQVTDLLESLKFTETRESRNLHNYYELAKENRDAYYKLSSLNRIINGKPINLIQNKEKTKVFVKTPPEKNLGVNNEQKSAA